MALKFTRLDLMRSVDSAANKSSFLDIEADLMQAKVDR